AGDDGAGAVPAGVGMVSVGRGNPSGQPLRNDDLIRFDRGKKLFCFLTRRKATEFAIVEWRSTLDLRKCRCSRHLNGGLAVPCFIATRLRQMNLPYLF